MMLRSATSQHGGGGIAMDTPELEAMFERACQLRQ